MTTKKKTQKRVRNYKCQSCSFVATGPTKLSQHYKTYPNHRVKDWRAAARKSTASALPQTRKQPHQNKRRIPLNFCPNCGLQLKESD